jgi:hypothetical protein
VFESILVLVGEFVEKTLGFRIGDITKKIIINRRFDASLITKDEDEIPRPIGIVEGARLTGGGFGGFTVSLIHSDNYQEWKNNMYNFYDSKNIFEV